MAISAAMLPEFDQEMATTRKVLSRIKDETFDYKPHEKSFSTAQLSSHIVEMIGWLVPTLGSDSFDINPPGGAPYNPWVAKTGLELIEKFDENSAAARTGLAAASDGQMMAPWSLLNGGQTLFTMPRVACVRGMIFNHIIHHRGQLTVYLRMNNLPVPAMYGPSADEQS